MKNTSLTLVAAKALPGLMTESLTYNAAAKAFFSQGWTSLAGNTYQKMVRGTNGLVVICDLGYGTWRTFLNGITLVGFDGKQPRVIAKKSWGGVGNWIDFSEYSVKKRSIGMLSDFLLAEAKQQGQSVSQDDARNFASQLIEQTYRKQIA